jgi:hypothetical protein
MTLLFALILFSMPKDTTAGFAVDAAGFAVDGAGFAVDDAGFTRICHEGFALGTRSSCFWSFIFGCLVTREG